jgi:hypothetical protein
MKLTTGIAMLATRNVEKNVSKKILYANTADKLANNKSVLNKAEAVPNDPIYFQNSSNTVFNPDIRFNNTYGYSPLTNINYRNDLLVFAENQEIKKAVNIVSNECVTTQLKTNKYPVFPVINMTLIPEDKKNVAEKIQTYLDEVFYPKLWQFCDLKKNGLLEKIREYLVCGKLAFEILYDNLKNPKNIIGVIPIDPASLMKYKKDGLVYYVQRPIIDGTRERVLHENQVILIEWNPYDYGYVSYVDQLKRPFNIMRSMQTSKILWFAVKSQVRLHIKFNMGDVSRSEALNKLSTAKEKFANSFAFDDTTGQVKFNGRPNSIGYREFYTAETAASGSPEIEEVNTQGPDLTEVDSLQYWEKYYWKFTDIPYDRIDPNASDTWGFIDVTNLRKIELNFSKMIETIRDAMSEMFLKLITIQLTLQEIEIGIDLSLLDSIQINWVAFNEYDKLGELELLNKKIEICTNLAQFGEMEDANGTTRKAIPITWIMKNYLDFTPEQLESMEIARREENLSLGFNADGTPKEIKGSEEEPASDESGEDLNFGDEESVLSDEEW